MGSSHLFCGDGFTGESCEETASRAAEGRLFFLLADCRRRFPLWYLAAVVGLRTENLTGRSCRPPSAVWRMASAAAGHLPAGVYSLRLLRKQPVHSVYGGTQTNGVNQTFLQPYRNADSSLFCRLSQSLYILHILCGIQDSTCILGSF